MKETNPFLSGALFYARELRWAVFPLRPRAKEPLTEHGHKEASLHEKQIREWWAKWPKANIGIPTGIWFWVLDIDPRHGGDASLMALVARHTALVDTIQQLTGGGGRQYFFGMPDQMKIGCHVGVWDGIDVRGQGGYIVVPPSIHPSGKPYVWDGAKKITEQTMNPANPWLIVELMAATNGHRSSEPFELPQKIRKGLQHITLFKLGASLRRKGCEESEILAALWEVNQSRCEEPGSRENIARLAESICRQYPAWGPPKSPPTPPFRESEASERWDEPIPLQSRVAPAIPSSLIPGALGDMSIAVSKATEIPLAMPALVGLPVVASCIAGKVEVEVEKGYVESVNLYTTPAMEPGNRRTAVVNEMIRPVTEYESAERKRLQPEIKRAQSIRKTIEERIALLRKKAAKIPGDTTLVNQIADEEANLPDIPQLPQLWTQDVTPEELAERLKLNREVMGVFSDEGDLFDLLAGRYTGGAPNFVIFLNGHSGSSTRVNRVSRPPIFLDHPLLSIALSPQPDVLERLRDTPAFRRRGFLARFLYGLPASPLGYRKLDPPPVPEEIRETYRKLIFRLIQLTPPAPDGVWQPWRLKLSPEAYRTWKQFQRDVETMMRDGNKLEHLRDWASKLPGAVVRVAGVFHAVVVEDLPQNLVISHDTMERAIKLGTALIDHALAAFDLMERDPKFAEAQKILEWIRREGQQTFTLRDCFCAHQGRFKRVDALRPVLALLVEHGYLRLLPKTMAPNRPSEPIAVNPQVLEGK
jgi:hypothetical protein